MVKPFAALGRLNFIHADESCLLTSTLHAADKLAARVRTGGDVTPGRASRQPKWDACGIATLLTDAVSIGYRFRDRN
jgi:hypothetical protein